MKKKLLFSLLFLSSIAATLNAQFNYQAVNAVVASGTYTDLAATGTAINTKFNGGGPITFDDDTSAPQNIGFNFVYNGTTFTQFVLCTNGFIKLGTAAPTSIYDVLTTFESNVIAPYNQDLDGGTSPEYRVATTGTTGSRVTTIQFKNVKDWSATVGQYTNINFQIKLYETTNNIEFVYGAFTASVTASAILASTIGITGSAVAASVNATKASTGPWGSATYLEGAYTGNKFNNRNSVLPTSGQTYRFVAVSLPPNDLAVTVVYAHGAVALNNRDTIKAVITNTGTLTQTNKVVSLNITGVFPFSDTKTITSIAPGERQVVTFAPYRPSTLGSDTLTVSVPADELATNNTKGLRYSITQATQSYYTGGAVTALGFTVVSDFVQRFSISSPATVSQLNIAFVAGAAVTYRAAIFNASGTGGSPGTTPIWESGDLTTPVATSFVNIPVTPGLALPIGSFYVGIRQTTTTSARIAGETENPVRIGSIFFRQGAGAWTDFSPINNFKLAIDVVFGTVGLPVEITQFKGEKKGIANFLTWSTATEINNKGFALERSIDGVTFSSIATIESKTINGNSNSTLNYEYQDSKPFVGNNYYRLKQIDKDGKSTYSQIVLLKSAKVGNITISAIYPNPAKDKLNITILSGNTEKATLAIYDATGRLVLQKSLTLIAGEVSLSENIDKLKAGSYLVKVIDEKGYAMDIKTLIKQ